MTDYKFEAGKTYNLRGGGTAEILKVGIELSGGRSIVGIVYPISGLPFGRAWNDKGEHYPGEIWAYDLLPPELERVSVWLNWYGEMSGDGYSICVTGSTSREEADKHAWQDRRTHVFEIILEDGKPVDVKIHKVER